MWVMTFHSACARILRADATRLGYKRAFTIYDEADSLRMVKRCMDELELDPKRYPPRAIKAAISAAKNQLVDATDYAEAVGSGFEEAVADVYNLYERRMVEASAMDFDDLLVRTVNLLELFADVREKYRRIFRWVLVDEYQDTNRAQYRMLQLLTSEHRNLTVVGDEDQSIYGFRGADIRNILDFDRDFPDAEVVKLEQNYRSTQTILDAANAVVSNNTERREKHLWTDEGAGEPIVVGEFDDEHAEARYVASEINRLVEEGDSRDQIAVFYRMNAQSRVLEDTLVRFEIPYQVIGGTKFYERAEIKDAVAYLQLLANPADAISFSRIVNSPRRGIGQQTEARMLSHANTLGVDIWDVLANPTAIPGLGQPPRSARSTGSRRRCRPAPAGRARRAGRRAARGDAARDRLHRGAGGRAHGRGRGPDREPRGAGRRRRRVRRQPGARGRLGDLAAGGVPGPDLAGHRAGQHPRRGEPGDADVAAQRQGPRVRRRVHHRLRGGRVPALALARGGQRRGGAPARLRRRHPRPRRLWLTYARRRALHGGAAWNLPSRFLDELPESLVERHVATTSTGWSLGGGDARRRATGFGERRRRGPDDARAASARRRRRCRTRSATTSSTPASARGW